MAATKTPPPYVTDDIIEDLIPDITALIIKLVGPVHSEKGKIRLKHLEGEIESWLRNEDYRDEPTIDEAVVSTMVAVVDSIEEIREIEAGRLI